MLHSTHVVLSCEKYPNPKTRFRGPANCGGTSRRPKVIRSSIKELFRDPHIWPDWLEIIFSCIPVDGSFPMSLHSCELAKRMSRYRKFRQQACGGGIQLTQSWWQSHHYWGTHVSKQCSDYQRNEGWISSFVGWGFGYWSDACGIIRSTGWPLERTNRDVIVKQTLRPLGLKPIGGAREVFAQNDATPRQPVNHVQMS